MYNVHIVIRSGEGSVSILEYWGDFIVISLEMGSNNQHNINVLDLVFMIDSEVLTGN